MVVGPFNDERWAWHPLLGSDLCETGIELYFKRFCAAPIAQHKT